MKEQDHHLIVEHHSRDLSDSDFEIEHPGCPITWYDGGMYGVYQCEIESLVDHWGLDAYIPWWLLPSGTYGLRHWVIAPRSEHRIEGIILVPADLAEAQEIARIAQRAGHGPYQFLIARDGARTIEWKFDLGRRIP